MKHCCNPDCAGLARDGIAGEFFPHIETCPDCGARLAQGEAPKQAAEPAVYRELETVYLAQSQIIAVLLKERLDAEGLDAVLSGEALSSAVGELPATVLQIEVQVSPEDAQRALPIVADFEAQQFGRPAE